MRYSVCFVTFLALFLAQFGYADDPVFSGPQPGEPIAPFKVLQVAGPRAGEELSLLNDKSDAPTVLIFVHEATRPGLQLMRPLDWYGQKLASEGVVTHFVWLTADRSKTEDWLRTARASLNLKSPVSISMDGIEGPGSYGLNRKVTLTVLVAEESKVTANFAIVQPNETDAPKILDAMATLVGKKAPTLEEVRAEVGGPMRREMTRPAPAPPRRAGNELSKLTEDPAALIQEIEEKLALTERTGSQDAAATRQILRLEAQIARLQARDQEHHARALQRVAELEKTIAQLLAALNESRETIAKLQGKASPEPIKLPAASDRLTNEPTRRPAAELPGRTPSDPELIALMRRMIQPATDEAAVKEIVAAMTKWVGDDPQRKDDLQQFAKRIAHLGYGSDAAKQEIRRLANDR